MTRLITYVAAGVIALSSGLHAATAANPKPEVRCSSNQPAKVELACGLRAFRSNRSSAHWIRNHRTLAVVLEHRTAHSLRYYVWREKVARRWISQAHARLHPRPVGPTGFPPHHALWMCLHSIEAGSWYDRDSGGSHHYGGLQMTYNWGHGIVGYPYNYSQAQQEWAAERGYETGGPAFVYQQWLKWEHGVGDKCKQYE